jgi:hypothetical protein
MRIEEIVEKIKILAAQHHAIEENDLDEIKEVEFLEVEAEDLITAYCVYQNYLINGFPTEKKAIEEELDDDYFCRERYQLYLDQLALQKEDVAKLMWRYTSNFWPDYFESKEEYITSIEHQIKSGVFYEVDLD